MPGGPVVIIGLEKSVTELATRVKEVLKGIKGTKEMPKEESGKAM
jgi:hypothetical protein